MNYYVGIDIGGTYIKGGIVDTEGDLLVKGSIPSEIGKPDDYIVNNIANFIIKLCGESGVPIDKISGIGMGIPGYIDSENGIVITASNLGWTNFNIVAEMHKHFDIPVIIANDANTAALGEAKFGSAKKYKNSVFFTLGTGVGGGIIIDGKIYAGNKSAGAEIGHMIIYPHGEHCSCGNDGCLEAYASATALIRETKKAMTEHKDSLMWEVGSLDNVGGKTAFIYADRDVYAKKVVDKYIYDLAVGIANMANVLRPEIVIVCGGVAKQGASLIDPLNKLVAEMLYARGVGPQVPVVGSSLSETGVYGAAALNLQ